MLSIQALTVLVTLAASCKALPSSKEELQPYGAMRQRFSEDQYSANRRDAFRRYPQMTTSTIPPVSQKEYDDVKGLLDRVEDEMVLLRANMTMVKGNLSRCISNSNELRGSYDGHKRDYEELKRENAKEIQKSVAQFNSIVELKMTIKNLEHQLEAERSNLTSSLQDCNDSKKDLSEQLDAAEEENNQFRVADAFRTEDCQMLNDTLNELSERTSDNAYSDDFRKCLDTVTELENRVDEGEQENVKCNRTAQICQMRLDEATFRCSAAQVDLIQNSFASTNTLLYGIIAVETAILFIVMVAVKVYLCKREMKSHTVTSIDDRMQEQLDEIQMEEHIRFRE